LAHQVVHLSGRARTDPPFNAWNAGHHQSNRRAGQKEYRAADIRQAIRWRCARIVGSFVHGCPPMFEAGPVRCSNTPGPPYPPVPPGRTRKPIGFGLRDIA